MTNQMAVVTCQTPDCPSSGVPVNLAVTYTDDDGNETPVDMVICGACAEEITNVTALG